MSREVEFWFDFASTYSFLSALRIEKEAASRDVTVRWRPFLLGPTFAAQGWNDSPFNIYPAKGRYMWRDVERRAARFGIPFRRPERFPQASLLAARAALVASEAGQGPAFCKAVFAAEFSEGRDIVDAAILDRIGETLGLRDVTKAASAPAIKDALRAHVEEAMAKGLFGAPSFLTKGELFWGDDRLEEALDWAAR